jgi:hypothetical protein
MKTPKRQRASMSNLHDEIVELISLKKEGEFWDFKLKHHDNPVDLVKDITCLANTVRHEGPRYLVLGVCPDTYQVTGIVSGETRRSQADIISTLRNANFAAAHSPDIRLEAIEMEGEQIDVIVIADTAHKPHYLEADYTKTGKTMRAGVIYSRTQDTNTPNDRSAPATDIEKMWRERFRLDSPPLTKVASFIGDRDGWKAIDNIEPEVYHYRNFPEYTIEISKEPDNKSYREVWLDNFPDQTAQSHWVDVKYHSTIIKRMPFVHCDGYRFFVPVPRRHTDDDGKTNYWYYKSQRMDYRVFNLLAYIRCGRDTNNLGQHTGHFLRLSQIKVIAE